MKTVRTFYAGLYLVMLYAPICLVTIFSFNDSIYPAFPFKGFTLNWYDTAINSAGLREALGNSLIIAVTTSLLATAIGLAAALAVARYHFGGRSAVSMLLYAPLAVPSVVAGVALMSILIMLGIRLSIWSVVLGHLLICTPFAFGVLLSRLEGMNPDLEKASMDLGEPSGWTFVRITLPQVSPGLLSSVMLCFTISLDEFILAFFLSSNAPTLPVFMWSQMRFPDRLPMVLALATAVLIFSAVIVVLALVIQRRNLSTQPRGRNE